ncbi:hypothetical protein OSB04_018639 [Centaurea solstitialis]|uniref:Uncharacterized protein n=1 Tax=Centaurea solstitialis TaxID=347529 RepID=A0AA38T590_9ASTR|nr:hypothetical protein OSB04_018639 [Centaurea solstitialis]
MNLNKKSNRNTLPVIIPHLPNLKVLNLANSINLVRTPDFGGLPCLERVTFTGCAMLTEIHPSIGYLERLISLDMTACTSLEIFPPIIRMKKLETLILSDCDELHKFPEIQTSMDSLKEFCLRETGIEVVPLSIGEYCTNLCSLDLRYCNQLQSIEGNFHHLKDLKRLYVDHCDQLENMPKEGLFDVECCLQQLSLSSTFFDGVRRGSVNKLLGFPRFLTRLSLSSCGLVDGDNISVLFKELSNLQVLDLSYNSFSRLHSDLSQLPRLKYLNLSCCINLVELPDLPSSISVLLAEECRSLIIKEDFPTNQLKWLWKISLSESNYIGKRVLQLMLQTNAIEDYFVSIRLDMASVPISDCKLGIFTLLLPQNWYDQFSGFLVYMNDPRLIDRDEVEIIMKDVTGSAKENDVLEEYNGVEGFDSFRMCYIPFNLVRHSSRWNRENTTISFSINNFWLNVKLVDKRSQSDDSIERAKGKTYRSEFWDEESWDQKTFEVIDDSRTSIKIRWCHDVSLQMSPRKRRL